MTNEEIKKILENHKSWLDGKHDSFRLDKWVPVLERLPKTNGEFLVSMEMEMVGEIYTYIDLAYFAQDLCAIDDRGFHDKKGISGFYKHDTEWGDNYEIYPIAWQPLPKAYKEEIK